MKDALEYVGDWVEVELFKIIEKIPTVVYFLELEVTIEVLRKCFLNIRIGISNLLSNHSVSLFL